MASRTVHKIVIELDGGAPVRVIIGAQLIETIAGAERRFPAESSFTLDALAPAARQVVEDFTAAALAKLNQLEPLP